VRELLSFVLNSPDFFDTLSNRPITSEYSDLIKAALPTGWLLHRYHVWLAATTESARIPTQGFKIHISGIPLNASDLLTRVVPQCVEECVTFKVVADPFLLTHHCSKGFDRGSSGKFITIYPPDLSVFTRLIEKLHQTTTNLNGPYILSDKRYKNSKVIFYRYGGFIDTSILRVDGAKDPFITSPTGRMEPDLRRPIFFLPEWIDDPFASDVSPVDEEDSDLLHHRYRIEDAIVYSNSGGIYRALDVSNGSRVILKEARPLTGYFHDGESYVDAVKFLEGEYDVLRKLQHLPCVPKPIEVFSEWEHFFLAEELIEGSLLSSYRASPEMCLSPFVPDRTRANNFFRRFRAIAENLIRAVKAIHQEGILIGDLSPHNVFVNPDNFEVTLIDFESAVDLNNAARNRSFSAAWSTPGFRKPGRRRRLQLTREDDFYSLAMLLYSLVIPIQNLFEIDTNSRDLFIDRIAEVVGLPSAVKKSIELLSNARPDTALEVLSDRANDCYLLATEHRRHPATSTADPVEKEIPGVLEEIKNYLLNTFDLGRTDRLWPSDYSIFFTNALSVGFGACGTVLCLRDLQGIVPTEIKSWLTMHPISPASMPPGLFVGLSGLSLTYLELGNDGAAADTMRLAYSSPLLFEDPTFFWGVAGWGLASLHLYAHTGDPEFLSKAIEGGEFLLSTAYEDAEGCSWRSKLLDRAHLGIAYGSSGIALFLLHLAGSTSNERYLTCAKRAIAFDVAGGRSHEGRLTWGRFPEDPFEEPYWLHGAAGIGSVLIRFFEKLNDPNYLILAEQAATGAFTRFSVLPSQFEGLSGIGEFMIDMHLASGDPKYHKRACEIAESVLCYRIRRKEGCAFPGKYLIRISNDYGYGSAGVGCFLHRLIAPGVRRFHDIGPAIPRPIAAAR
jgi:serine/threonine protein kinase